MFFQISFQIFLSIFNINYHELTINFSLIILFSRRNLRNGGNWISFFFCFCYFCVIYITIIMPKMQIITNQ